MAKGGIEHRRAQIIIRDYYRRMGKIAIIEGFVGGKHVDVFVYDPVTGGTKALEYETANIPHVLNNIFIDSRICDEVITVSLERHILDGIKVRAERAFGSRECVNRQFRLLKDFVPQGAE